MAPTTQENLLSVCSSHCAGLLTDVKSVPQLKNLHWQTKALRSSLKKTKKALRMYNLDSFDSDPTRHPGLSLLAAYLFNLRNICGYYGMNTKTTWRLDSDQRASALNGINNPFGRLAEKLSHVAQELKVLVADRQTDSQEWAQNLCKWAESMINHWDFFKREFGAARGLAVAASAAAESHHLNLTTTIPENYVNLHDCGMASGHGLPRPQVWDDIRCTLAAEGIGDDAIAKVADDLKACVRDLVRGQRPEALPHEPELVNPTVNTSECPAIEELRAFQSLVDRETISSRLRDALDKISTDFDQVATEFLTVALQKDEDEGTETFRQTLDVIYFTACRDTTRAKTLAKLAKHIQYHATPRIRELMMSKKWATTKAEGGNSTGAPGPVTSWYLGRCREAWERGRNGKNKFSAEDLAFGLPRFIGELAKSGVFQEHHVHIYIRNKLDYMIERDQFVAVYQLLRTTGHMCEGKKMRAHFDNITSLVDDEDTPNCIKLLAQELINLRDSGWKLKESKLIDQVEAEMRNSIVQQHIVW